MSNHLVQQVSLPANHIPKGFKMGFTPGLIWNKKKDKLVLFFLSLYALGVLFATFRLPVVTIGLMGLVIIIVACIRWGLSGGAIAFTYSSALIVFTYFQHGGILHNIFFSIILFFFLTLFLGKSIDTINEQTRELVESEYRYRQLFENSKDAMMTIDPFTMAVTSCNKAVLDLFGVASVNEFLRLNLIDLSPGTQNSKEVTKEIVRPTINEAMNKGSLYFEWLHQRLDGQLFPATVLLTKVEIKGQPLLLSTIRDVTSEKEAEKEILYMSSHDRLTDLYNRHYLEKEVTRLKQEKDEPLAVIMADLNGLKLVNDSYGRQKGDEMLKSAAKILKETCREEHILARWGGDEFIILLPGSSEKTAQRICRSIDESSSNVFVGELPVSIATGIACKKDGVINPEDLLREAEDNMHKVKLTESRSAKNSVLQTLLKTLAEKSYETEAHTRRMQEIAKIIGIKINLPNAELSRLELLITLHDIGKINISEEILTKEGPLDNDEWEVIKMHPEIGFRIAKASDNFAHVAEEILSHHERWDGSGYPRGLKGEQIPLLARITAVADAYEVMSNGRPYKEAMSSEEIIKEFQGCSGTHFDPELVEIFLSSISIKNNDYESSANFVYPDEA